MEQYLGEKIPKLGFGLMRLPMKDNAIDIEQTKAMVDRFLEEGFYYFDTAYGYNNGESEKAIKKALVDRYPREKFMLATKLPAWAGAKNREEAEQMFYTSLERTGAGYFDFYLLHNLGEQRTHFFDDYDIWNFLAEKKKEGLIKHLGFSMHDKAEVLDEILTAHPEMEFVQLQINYADWEDPTIESQKCYEVARKHQKPIIIMEPVKGGTLANPPKEVTEVLRQANPKASPSSWAIRFAASLDGVITVLSGMSNMEQMEDNLSYMKEFQPLTTEEQKTVETAREIFNAFPKVPCTACAYCMKGCPQHIAIYGSFQAYNIYSMYGDLGGARNKYTWNTDGHGWKKASACIACGKCEKVCPQHISIREELKKVAAALEG
ncbi:aldo/keto reductase [Mediterraneibacter sp. NSJ-55]|uniref:Aldo/keto reductase n=1 Tax=Mediterraneibacter hominis TaxID=2763054 RepID=A0A923LHR3_9FIRM|nr:aldo/keto reductase [Mediterraneibacter hominis]MBC5688504.1 aldo/keto reductase [Mediterraneibacter hominis]